MFLKDYIENYAHSKCRGDMRKADEELAVKFEVSARTIQSWRLEQRNPQVEVAREIVRKTKGIVDYEGIYAPYKKTVKR